MPSSDAYPTSNIGLNRQQRWGTGRRQQCLVLTAIPARVAQSTPGQFMFDQIISKYGATAKAKLSSPAITGAPEDNIRAPLEELITALAETAGQQPGWVTLVGESTLSALGTRPDYAVTVRNALTGFIELKAPGKGADPRKFTDPHDKRQWQKLKSLPNLIYIDRHSLTLWHNGPLLYQIP